VRDGVWPEARFACAGVDVVCEPAAAAAFRIDRGRRVVAGDDNGAFHRLACRREPFQPRFAEGELSVAGKQRVVAALRGDDAGPSSTFV
jgi:hypothetical protein